MKSKKKLKVLVIGYGSIGKKHCEILKKISSSIHVLTKQKVKNFNKDQIHYLEVELEIAEKENFIKKIIKLYDQNN